MIQNLIELSHAYQTNGEVYFRVRSYKEYGKLSGRRLDEMQVGTRIEVDDRKEDPLDFALWKASKPGEPAWQSPWGAGRPGWHIECSAMNIHHLGEQIDIHGGGNDLVFPHHENEIAQSESLTGKPFARYWVLNDMLQLSGEKMSNSLGNLITIEEFLTQYEPDVLRVLVLTSNYRATLTLNEETITNSRRALDRLKAAIRPALSSTNQVSPETIRALEEQMEITRRGFQESMDDDFATAGAMGHLFALVRSINLTRDAGADNANLNPAQNLLRELSKVLGLSLDQATSGGDNVNALVNLLVEVRTELRDHRLLALSDKVRDELADLGVILEDSKEGTTWRWQ
jgi:cysteinyl-tRNA synthetase